MPSVRPAWIPSPLRAIALAVVFLAVGVVASTSVYARNRIAALQRVRSTKGEVEFAPLPKWIPEGIEVPEWLRSAESATITRGDDRDLVRIVALSELKRLACWGGFTDQGMQHISRLSRLEAFSSGRISDAGVAALRNCRRLSYLSLRSDSISDEGLKSLAGLPLSQLHLSGKQITSIGIAHLSQLPLETLDLSSTGMTDECFPEIAKISTLKGLSLEQTRVTGKGLRFLAHLPLEVIVLERSALTDEGLAEAAEIPSLRSLMLSRTSITDAGLAGLAGHPFEYIELIDTNVTPAGVQALCETTSIKRLAVDSPPFTEEHSKALKLRHVHLGLLRKR